MTDQELVQACLNGEMSAFGEIIHRYQRKIMAFTVNTLGNFEDAEDVCQEAFLKAFHNLGKYDPSRDFKNWFYTLTHRLCIDRIRKKKRLHRFVNRIKTEPECPKSVLPEDSKFSRLAKQNYLRKLTTKEKTAVMLWANESYSAEEIGSVLRCSASTARVYLYRARKKIKQEISHVHKKMQSV